MIKVIAHNTPPPRFSTKPQRGTVQITPEKAQLLGERARVDGCYIIEFFFISVGLRIIIFLVYYKCSTFL